MKKIAVFFGCLLCATISTMQNNLTEQLNPSLKIEDKKEILFDLNSIKASGDELSNREILEKQYGFTFSGLKKEIKKKSAPIGVREPEKLELKPEWLPIILQLMNNNFEAHAQKTEKTISGLAPTTSKFKSLLNILGLGSSSAGGSILGGAVTLGILIVVQKYKLI